MNVMRNSTPNASEILLCALMLTPLVVAESGDLNAIGRSEKAFTMRA